MRVRLWGKIPSYQFVILDVRFWIGEYKHQVTFSLNICSSRKENRYSTMAIVASKPGKMLSINGYPSVKLMDLCYELSKMACQSPIFLLK